MRSFVYKPSGSDRPFDASKCAACVWSGSDRPTQCERTGSLKHEGFLWCKTHHPPTRREREKARIAQEDAEQEREARIIRERQDRQLRDESDLREFRALARAAAADPEPMPADSRCPIDLISEWSAWMNRAIERARRIAALHKEQSS